MQHTTLAVVIVVLVFILAGLLVFMGSPGFASILVVLGLSFCNDIAQG